MHYGLSLSKVRQPARECACGELLVEATLPGEWGVASYGAKQIGKGRWPTRFRGRDSLGERETPLPGTFF